MFKFILKKITVYILILEARLVLYKYRPKIVAITGNTGKTSSGDAIYTVLSSVFFVRKNNEKNTNNDIGIISTILGITDELDNFLLWFKIIDGLKLIILKNHYPKWLILEVGADKPGCVANISKWLKPDIVVMTHIPDVPMHVESFESANDVIKEKSNLVKALKDEGVFIVNRDDKKTLAMKTFVGEKKIFTYGFSEGGSIVASKDRIVYYENKPKCMSFRVDYNGNSIPVELKGVVGKQHIYAVLSAFAVGISQGMNIVNIKHALVEHESARGRMRIIEGINNSSIIDDSYDASPTSMFEALNTLKDIVTTGRKIAVLGDMMELGSYSTDEHIKIGGVTARIADILITIGVRSKYIAQGANEAKMKKKNIFQFNDSIKAGSKLANIIAENDLVLIKGSQSIMTEKVVEKVMADPNMKYRFLVRYE